MCTAKGAIVIVCTTPHNNVEHNNVKNITLGNLNVVWPVRTFNVTGNFTFDSSSNTIHSTAFSYDTGNAATSWGGQILRRAISFGSVAAMQATTQLPAFLLIVTLLLWQKIFRSLA